MNTWIEISKANLSHNISEFKKITQEGVILAPPVKGNAYGHGLEICAKTIIEAGSNWLSVFSLEDLKRVRAVGIQVPVLVLGYIPIKQLAEAIKLNPSLVIANLDSLIELDKLSKTEQKPIKIHLKLETGNHRYGIFEQDIQPYLQLLKANPLLQLEGVLSHFANVEDTTDHSYAEKQLSDFDSFVKIIEHEGFSIPYQHISNSASTILWPKAHFNLVRPGIATYGMWPSQEVYRVIDLQPIMTWKTIVSQVRQIEKGQYIGYGCTYKTTRPIKMAVLPIGYYDGYDRRISNTGYVLIKGQRAQVIGRVCMNVTMVDVTDIEGVKLEDEVVLLGQQVDDSITAETMANWAQTINYEVTTRINERIERRLIEKTLK